MIKTWFLTHPTATVTEWLKGTSSFISSIRYDKVDETLFVLIKQEIYKYKVDLDLADKFSNASSWGSFYNSQIKQKKSIPVSKEEKVLLAGTFVAGVGLAVASTFYPALKPFYYAYRTVSIIEAGYITTDKIIDYLAENNINLDI